MFGFERFLNNTAMPQAPDPDDTAGAGGAGDDTGTDKAGSDTNKADVDNSTDKSGDVDKAKTDNTAGDKSRDKSGDAGEKKADTDKARPGDAGGEDTNKQDWRREMAGEDEDVYKMLNRYTTPKDAIKALKNAQDKIRSGELKAPLPKDATPEQIKEYREANKIPEKADGYLNELPDGLVFGDEDKTAMAPFLEEMHQLNAPKEYVQSALKAYTNAIIAQNERIMDQDATLKAETEDVLRAEWGGDYRANLAAANNMLDAHFPAEVKAALLNARDEQSRPIIYNAGFLQAMAQLGRELNPVGSVYGTGADNLGTIEDEIKTIESKMGTKAYEKDPKMQERYRELVKAKERYASK